MVEDNKNKENNAPEDSAKSKIILFVIGVLLGAVISASSLLIGINVAGNRPANQPSQFQPSSSSNMPNNPPDNQRGQNNQRAIPQKGQNDQKSQQ
ncbi:hypothetical protein IKF15_01470 [Candidatus Saccharibacteria bacterium]|nr:hypothetical protein [Candidatus Saccharibacteria bacterium]